MSGFFGVFSPDGNIDKQVFYQMGHAIQKEGYDELQIVEEEFIAMGHQMLRVTPDSIYDQQPVKSTCGRYLLVGHFRLDYRDELGDKLGLTSDELEKIPDSKLVLEAFKKWKNKVVNHLEGDWTFIIFDFYCKSLFIAKDPSGLSAIFFIKKENSIVFSSDPTIFSEEIDHLQLIYFSIKGFRIDKGKTLFKELNCLQNGYSCEIDSNLNFCFKQYFDVNAISVSRLYKYDEDAFLDLKTVFTNSVKSRSRSICSNGIFLSSGLDSMAVAGISSRELSLENKILNTFTSIPSKLSKISAEEVLFSDESKLVQKVFYHDTSVKSFFCGFEDFIFSKLRLNELKKNPFNPYVTLNSFWIEGIFEMAKKKGVRSMMNAQMGNYTISSNGYFEHFELLKKLKLKEFVKEIYFYAKQNEISILQSFKKRFLSILKLKISFFFKSLKIQTKNFLKEHGFFVYGVYKPYKKYFLKKRNELVPGYHALPSQRALRIKQLEKNLYYSNIYWYLYASAYGIQISDPTSDSRVIHFTLSISENLFFKKGVQKYLYKGTFSNILQKEVVENTQKAVQSFDYGDRLVNDSHTMEFLIDLINQHVSDSYDNSLLIKELSEIINHPRSNYQRRQIMSFLHKISVLNFTSRG
jgi:asparagine synthase (glutamine-hydrolysing)